MRRRDLLRLTAGAAIAPAATARADTYPARPVTILVGFPAGTASDTVSRFLAERLASRLGQPVLVENRPGVDGGIAATAVARARADGHTLLYSTSSAHAANVSLYRTITYDPVTDFAPVAGILRQPTVVLVRQDSTARSVQELAALSRARVGGLNYGYGNTSTRVVGALLQQRGGVQAQSVSFRGNPQSLTELMAGRLDFAVSDAFTGAAQAQAGTLRALAVSGDAPTPRLPGVPSLVQAGVLENAVVAWTGVFAPAAVPGAIVARLETELQTIMAEPDGTALLDRLVAEPFMLSGAALGQYMRADIARWAEYVRLAGIEPQ
ncbi:tripartite tricarboxylate transporter substrate binding protein [Roseomonas sp. CAU 1739]|uniref:tripartite tricarboxylate transporter substrate binding protein n=1 Tax=Roseomonas sp. CAU 1739 TaxID=3140364 RepID=UPI00325C07B6